MISYLEGKLAEKHPTHCVIDVGGIGLHVNIPLSSYDAIQEVGASVRVLTHLHVREDALALYGFSTAAERELFELLIGVSGIGPPMAQRILSGISIADFKRLVVGEDARGLTRIKGVGQKLAQRLILELKDKIGVIVPEDPGVGDDLEGGSLDLLEEATAALIGLGANPLQARKVVTQVIHGGDGALAVEEIIRRALRRI